MNILIEVDSGRVVQQGDTFPVAPSHAWLVVPDDADVKHGDIHDNGSFTRPAPNKPPKNPLVERIEALEDKIAELLAAKDTSGASK